ncbi:MAG: MerR family transcriptional regulator [Bryobacteraceae bacterium]|nr:MerR family transcriptional regulator [Bryobacteraceae bacterium]MDW8380462.1 MerR family transcriptional regulator [Bryobacterales bacterium]
MDNPRYVPIKTILQKTGVHRQTVHYYLRRSVLPPPIRTSRTSALYPISTIELIQLVQALQRQQRLSLEEIVELFRNHHYDVRAIRHAVSQQAPSLLSAQQPTLVPLGDVMELLTPSPARDWLDRVVALGIVRGESREGRMMLSMEAVETLRAVWEGVRAGASLEQFARLAQSMEKQAQEEFAQFLAGLQALPSSRETAPQVAKLFSCLERFGAHRRRDALQSLFMSRLRQPGNLFLSPNRTYVFPSRTLLQQMGLFRELDLILRKLDRNPRDLAVLHQLARASYLSSDWARLHTTAQEILRLCPQDAEAQACHGQALMYLGRLQEAVSFLEDVIARGTNPMAKIRLGQALAKQAYETGDASRLLDALVRRSRLAEEAIRESVGNPGLNRKVRLNAILDALYFTDPLGLNRPVEQDVVALYEEFSRLSDRRLSVLGKISLVMARMYVTYALYLVRHQKGDPKAPRLLKEIARMDPDCLLAARGLSKSAAS